MNPPFPMQAFDPDDAAVAIAAALRVAGQEATIAFRTVDDRYGPTGTAIVGLVVMRGSVPFAIFPVDRLAMTSPMAELYLQRLQGKASGDEARADRAEAAAVAARLAGPPVLRGAIDASLRELAAEDVGTGHAWGGHDCAAANEGLSCCLDPGHKNYARMLDDLSARIARHLVP